MTVEGYIYMVVLSAKYNSLLGSSSDLPTINATLCHNMVQVNRRNMGALTFQGRVVKVMHSAECRYAINLPPPADVTVV